MPGGWITTPAGRTWRWGSAARRRSTRPRRGVIRLRSRRGGIRRATMCGRWRATATSAGGTARCLCRVLWRRPRITASWGKVPKTVMARTTSRAVTKQTQPPDTHILGRRLCAATRWGWRVGMTATGRFASAGSIWRFCSRGASLRRILHPHPRVKMRIDPARRFPADAGRRFQIGQPRHLHPSR
jgi:hypothetical protein